MSLWLGNIRVRLRMAFDRYELRNPTLQRTLWKKYEIAYYYEKDLVSKNNAPHTDIDFQSRGWDGNGDPIYATILKIGNDWSVDRTTGAVSPSAGAAHRFIELGEDLANILGGKYWKNDTFPAANVWYGYIKRTDENGHYYDSAYGEYGAKATVGSEHSGTFVEDVYDVNPNAHPANGVQDGYFWVKQ